MPDAQEELELNALFERIGVTQEERLISRDLSKNAAEKALESIQIVAATVYDQRIRNVITLSACLLVGEAAEKTILRRLQSAMGKMPPDVRAKFEELLEEEAPASKPEPKTGVRDFDGNYQ